jgi:hypothetical protein
MRRSRLLTIAILVTITLLPSLAVRTQQPEEDKLPNMEDYPPPGANCKVTQKLAPSLLTPEVRPGKFRCLIRVYNCQTDKIDEYPSAPRDGGQGMCDFYENKKTALGERVVCCDQGSPEEERPPAREGAPPARECAPPTPWFGASSGCNEFRNTQIVISGGTAIVYMCGSAVFHYSIGTDELFDEAYRSAMRDFLKGRGLDKVCCDKFEDAVRTGKPCNPRVDVDCDGQPNRSDFMEGGTLPAIDGSFTVPSGESPDAFPPGMTVDAILPPDQCKGCRWELIKGVLKCNPDPTKRHTYESTWKCPSTGQVVEVDKLSPPGARCPY